MLKHQQIHVVGNRVWSPLGNKLPADKKIWMDDPIMRKAFFVPGRHSSSGLSGSKGLLDHLKMMEEPCTHHRALLLWYYVQGEEGAMVWNETCNGYRHPNEEVQNLIDKSKARNAPVNDNGFLVLYFQCMISGEKENKKRWRQGLKYNENIDWRVVGQLNRVHNYLHANGERNMQQIADLLRKTIMEMGELLKDDHNPMTQWTVQIVNMAIPRENNGDYTALGSMVKMLAKTYSTLSEKYVSLTESRVNELKIPLAKTTYNSDKKLHFVQLNVVLENRLSLDIISKTYETQKKTPCKLPPGVPTRRGKP